MNDLTDDDAKIVTPPGENRSLTERLALKLVVRELEVIDNRQGPTGNLLRSVTKADATADTIIAVFDLPMSQFGLRDAVRTFIAAAGPRPSLADSGGWPNTGYKAWINQIVGEVAVSLAGG